MALNSHWAPGGRQGQPRGAQLHAVLLSDWKGCSQDSTLPRPHLRVGIGDKRISLEICVYLRPSKGKQILSFISMSTTAMIEDILTCYSLGLCYSTVIATLSIVLQSLRGWFELPGACAFQPYLLRTRPANMRGRAGDCSVCCPCILKSTWSWCLLFWAELLRRLVQTLVPAQHLGLLQFRHVQRGNSAGLGAAVMCLLLWAFSVAVVIIRFSLMIGHSALILNKPWQNKVSQKWRFVFIFSW